jgi:membrane fusion protein, multidrug efflux system
MKKLNFTMLTILVLILVTSCNKQKDAKDLLVKLKKEQKTLEAQIDSLEKVVAAQNPSKQIEKAIYTEEIKKSIFTKYISLQGAVDAKNNVVANSESPGVVKSILVQVGQRVSAGQVLARLDDHVISEGINELDQQIAFAENIYQKQKNLWDQKIGTEVQYLSAKNNYESLIKKKNTTLAQRNLYTIKAPISGVVDDINIKIGEMASPGYPKGIRIISDKDLKVVAKIGEGYANVVNNGDEVLLYFPDLKDSIKTKIKYVSKTIDELSRAFNVEVALPQNSKFKPNMIVELKIAGYTNSKAMVVPTGLVQRGQEGDYIMIIRDGKLIKADVKTGEKYNGQVEILEGLKEKDQIISMGYQGLQEGDTFKIVTK